MDINEQTKIHGRKIKIWLIYQDLRERLWLSTDQAAGLCNISIDEYMKYEYGDDISGYVLNILGDKLGLSTSDLLQMVRNTSK